MIALTITSMVMIRLAWYLAADITILVIANSVVYIFADVDHPQGGIYFYFMTASMAGLILASYYHRVAGIVFGLLPVGLAFLAYLDDATHATTCIIPCQLAGSRLDQGLFPRVKYHS
jgi:hypothetical protein